MIPEAGTIPRAEIGLSHNMIAIFWQTFRRQINLCFFTGMMNVKFLYGAWKVITPTPQNMSLALQHLGLPSRILVQS